MQDAKLAVPMVHSNGTGKEGLVDQVMEAIDAARILIEALAKMAPHGRDYCLIKGDVLSVARSQHAARVDKVRSVSVELQTLAIEIDKQG